VAKRKHEPAPLSSEPSCAKCRHLRLAQSGDEFTCEAGGPLEPCDKFKDAIRAKPDVAGGITQVYRAGWGR